MNETPNPLFVVERVETEPLFVAATPVMTQVREALDRAAETDVRTVLYGEVGVGKGHAARYLHATSARRRGPLVGVDLRDRRVCSVLGDANLLAAATGGTLVLRAVDDASSEVQGLLVGLIEAWSSSEDGDAPVRVVATGRRDLLRGVEEGWFRKDLYYLLDVFPVVIPPLRERVEEISALLEHFFRKHGTDRNPPKVPDAFLGQAFAYDWPGNVRELENLVTGAVPLGASEPWRLPALLPRRGAEPEPVPFSQAKRQFERAYVHRLLAITEGNVTRAAELAGKARKDFYALMARNRIDPSPFRRSASGGF